MADGEIKTTEVIVDEGESGRMEWPYIPFKAWFKLVQISLRLVGYLVKSVGMVNNPGAET